MKGFVLAAGFGQRLAPLTNHLPKGLMPVGNYPLVAYSLRLLAYFGITDVIVNCHHLAKVLMEELGNGERYGVRITYSVEPEILGTGGGLKRMHKSLANETFVVINSDALIDLDLEAAIEAHRRRNALATMVLRENVVQDEGLIEIDSVGRVRRILGVGDGDEPLRSLMFTGVHIIEPRFLEYVPFGVFSCIVRYGYQKALANGEKIYGYLTDGYFADAGTPSRYYEVNRQALDRAFSLRHADPLAGYALSPKKDVADVVRLGDSVSIGDAVQLTPPVLLGDDVQIGERAVVGPYAVVSCRASIGKGATVNRSIVLPGTRVESGVAVSWNVIGPKNSLEIPPTNS